MQGTQRCPTFLSFVATSCHAHREPHRFTFVLTLMGRNQCSHLSKQSEKTLLSSSAQEHGLLRKQSAQTLLPCRSNMGQILPSRISRHAHEPKCARRCLACMLSPAAKPSLTSMSSSCCCSATVRMSACKLLSVHVATRCVAKHFPALDLKHLPNVKTCFTVPRRF